MAENKTPTPPPAKEPGRGALQAISKNIGRGLSNALDSVPIVGQLKNTELKDLPKQLAMQHKELGGFARSFGSFYSSVKQDMAGNQKSRDMLADDMEDMRDGQSKGFEKISAATAEHTSAVVDSIESLETTVDELDSGLLGDLLSSIEDTTKDSLDALMALVAVWDKDAFQALDNSRIEKLYQEQLAIQKEELDLQREGSSNNFAQLESEKEAAGKKSFEKLAPTDNKKSSSIIGDIISSVIFGLIGLKETILGKIKGIGVHIKKPFVEISERIGKIFAPVKSTFSKLAAKLEPLTKHLKPFLKVLSPFTKILRVAGSVFSKFLLPLFAIVDFFKGFNNAAEILGKDLADLSFMDKVAAGLGSAVGGLFGIVDAIAGLFGIDLDLSNELTPKFAKIFSDLFGGNFLESLAGFGQMIIDGFVSLGDIIYQKFSDSISDMIDDVASFFGGIFDFIKGLPQTIFNLLPESIQGLGFVQGLLGASPDQEMAAPEIGDRTSEIPGATMGVSELSNLRDLNAKRVNALFEKQKTTGLSPEEQDELEQRKREILSLRQEIAAPQTGNTLAALTTENAELSSQPVQIIAPNTTNVSNNVSGGKTVIATVPEKRNSESTLHSLSRRNLAGAS